MNDPINQVTKSINQNEQDLTEYNFNITPVPYPRMSQRDKWNPSEAAQRFFAFRDVIRYQSRKQSLYKLPGCLQSLIFNIPVPGSWSKQKKIDHIGQPHINRPDIDNLLSAVMNVFGEDCHIHTIRNASKVWSKEGSIILTLSNSQDELNGSDNQDI